MSSVRVLTTALGGSALVSRALRGDAPSAWYAPPPRDADGWRARAAAIARPVADWLGPLRPAFGEGGSRLLDRLGRTGVVVTTGQQAGLFGGPWYTWFKAIAAAELAVAIERECGVPAVAVFWAATDDADFAEAASTVVSTPRGVHTLTLTERPPDGVPMAYARLGPEADTLCEALATHAGSAADPTPLRAAQAFRAGATVGGAYVTMLRALLEPMGVVVLDAAHAAVGDAARPFLQHALREAPAVHEAIRARTVELERADFEAPVESARPLSLVFSWEPGPDGLPRKRRVSVSEAASATRGAMRLSPNVLLRPVLEAALLPTITYLAGPGELAYFAQVGAAADVLRLPRPLARPRWSGMLVPPEVSAVLAEHGLPLEALRDLSAVQRRLARAALPDTARAAIVQLQAGIERALGQLDGTLPPPVLDGAIRQYAHRTARLERRMVAAVRQREGALMQRLAAAHAVTYPGGVPQERVLNAVPLWSRYGESVIRGIRVACAAHANVLLHPDRENDGLAAGR